MLFVDNAVIQLCQFCLVPTLGSTNQITSNTLQAIDVLATALWTYAQLLLCILIAAGHTAVAVVVYRAVADVVLIEQIYYIHNSLWVVRSIAVNLHIEDVTATSKLVIWSLNLSLMLW